MSGLSVYAKMRLPRLRLEQWLYNSQPACVLESDPDCVDSHDVDARNGLRADGRKCTEHDPPLPGKENERCEHKGKLRFDCEQAECQPGGEVESAPQRDPSQEESDQWKHCGLAKKNHVPERRECSGAGCDKYSIGENVSIDLPRVPDDERIGGAEDGRPHESGSSVGQSRERCEDERRLWRINGDIELRIRGRNKSDLQLVQSPCVLEPRILALYRNVTEGVEVDEIATLESAGHTASAGSGECCQRGRSPQHDTDDDCLCSSLPIPDAPPAPTLVHVRCDDCV